ncbi:MAG: tail fiber domain-containing protein, partial [Chitinophagales bacterium]|nr:tail fiber domain-containing protein [Chitinophagales bacterium]
SKGGMYYDKDNKRFEFRDTFATRTFSVNFDGEGFLKGGLQLGNSSSTTAGTIRWTGTDFEGRTASGWVSLTAGGGGANTSLSNLTTTSINQNLLPSATNTRDLGSSTLRWKDLHLHNLKFADGSTQTTAGANTTLSNLGTTSINQNLLPSANNTRDLGSSSSGWKDLYLSGSMFNGGNRVFSVAGNGNVFAGSQAGQSNSTGYYNAALGLSALNFTTTGYKNTAVGTSALYNNTTGYHNTAVGYYAGQFNDANTNCSFFGFNANQTVNNDFSNSTALGSESTITASNQVRVGNGSVTSIGGFANWTNVSDARYKKEVQENVPGLEFISKLRPVTYHLDVNGLARFLGEGEFRPKVEGREQPETDVTTLELDRKARGEKEKILYTGFIAQEVEKAAQEVGYDFSGVDKPQNEHSLYGLRYAEFVVPLVKAVQELNANQQSSFEELKAENEKLKAENTELKAGMVDMQSRLAKLESLLSLTGEGAAEKQLSHETVTLSGGARLEQNVPNPFDGSTTIGYFVPDESARVQLQFTSATGEVLSTVDVSAGKGTVTVKAQDMPSGAYRYSLLVNGSVVDTKTMLLQK